MYNKLDIVTMTKCIRLFVKCMFQFDYYNNKLFTVSKCHMCHIINKPKLNREASKRNGRDYRSTMIVRDYIPTYMVFRIKPKLERKITFF